MIWIAGYAFSLGAGFAFVALLRLWMYRRVGVPAATEKGVYPWLLGLAERAFFTTVIAFDVSGSDALVIEEGHHILSGKKENVEGVETIMETSLRQIREFGEAVIVIDQEPTKLSNSIKANTYSKIIFNLGNGKDVLEIAKCAGLTKEEGEYIDWLEVGQAIVSLKGRVLVPLHTAFPKVEVRKGLVQDSDIVEWSGRGINELK